MLTGRVTRGLGSTPVQGLLQGACCVDGFVRVLCQEKVDRESKAECLQDISLELDLTELLPEAAGGQGEASGGENGS